MRFLIAAVVFVLALMPAMASASIYLWKDPVHDFTVSFPDSWRVQTVDVPSTRLRVAGALAEDMATCRVKAEKDGRLQIYPKRHMTTAVGEKLNETFWQKEIAAYDGAQLLAFFDPASLGNMGDATAIKMSYTQSTGDTRVRMYGAMIGSIHGDMRYVVSCSARIDEYAKYATLFASIMDSVELEAKYHPFAIGYYRDFLADPKLMLVRSKPGTIHPKNKFFLRSPF